MPALGDAEFRSLEAAVRRRFETWTGGATGREFLVLDAPFPIPAALSERLLDPGANAAPGADPGDELLAYHFELDPLANPVLRPIDGTSRVVADATRLSETYGRVLDRASPRFGGGAAPWTALYDEAEDGSRTPTPLYETYRELRGRVSASEVELHALELEPEPNEALIRAKRDELDHARVELAVRGRAEEVEAILARIRRGEDERRTWDDAWDHYHDGMFKHPQTDVSFVATRCRPVPRDSWIAIDLAPDDAEAGALLGQGETVRRIEAEAFPLFMDRSGWYDHGLLTRQPWDWHPVEAGRVLSDGQGGGEMPFLPVGAVLLRNIKITVQMPFEAPDVPSPGAPPRAPKVLPTLGKMLVPLRIQAVDGRSVASRRSVELQPLVAKPEVEFGTLSTLQRQAVAVNAASFPNLRAELRTLTAASAVEAATPRRVRPAEEIAQVAEARPQIGELAAVRMPATLRMAAVRPQIVQAVRPVDRSVLLSREVMVAPRPAAAARPAAKPGTLGLTTRRFAEGAWRPVPMTVTARLGGAAGGRERTLRSDEHGRLSTTLPPGRWELAAAGLEPGEASAPVTVRLASRGSASAIVAVTPLWTEVELTACGPGEGFMLFGYLADPYPPLPAPT